SIAIIFFTMLYTNSITETALIVPHLLSIAVVVLSMFLVLYIKRLYKSIDREKQYMNALFEYATEGVILTNDEGRIVLINPAALRLFGYEENELLGRRIEELIPTRFHHNHTAYREGFYKQPGNRTMGHGRDLFARNSFGEEFPVEVSLSFFKQRNEFYVIAFIVNITERKEAEKRLIEQKEQLERVTFAIRKLNAELETKVEERTLILREALHELERSQTELNDALNKEKELSELKSRFVSMASHEFRTPLSTVLSSASLISKYVTTEDQSQRERHTKRIKDSVKHLNDLLEDFLSLGKLEEGKININAEEIIIAEFIDELVEEIRAILKEGQHIEVHNQTAGSFVTDKKLLKNVMINLLSNAVKFSPQNKAVSIVANREPNRLQLCVSDQGIGISEEDQQHLFSSFYRGKNVTNIQGTGLGLHIVKRYLDLLGADIRLKSKLNEGTTVCIDVPLIEA
ncbi:MAG TPA: PAS domain-containing sensor histidine kinase, partial [Flavitalea sp.]|nr:PAS domain-containing sensor histidine kinase [Flavitalea sp.]